MNNLVLVTLDSCRYDTFIEARTPVLDGFASVERRYSYASWTAPSHYNLLMGLMPHVNQPGTHAAATYLQDFERHAARLGFPLTGGDGVKAGVEPFYFPSFLRARGYFTGALVSFSSLSPSTPLNRDFDIYRQMPAHNDMRAMLRELRFSADRPSFWLLNVGETHYPYATPDENPADWPRLVGVGGVFRELGPDRAPILPAFFDSAQMKTLRARQVRAIEYLDSIFAELFALVPRNTWIAIMGDHGELFGEDGFFGHGPIEHPKVFEVPFLENLVTHFR
jgi:hypothetical protein